MSNFKSHLEASKYVQTKFSLEDIHHEWNNSGKGRPAKIQTVKRWLNNGPHTKNPRFDPWLMDLANKLYKHGISSVVTMDEKATIVYNRIVENKCGSDRQKETAMSLCMGYMVSKKGFSDPQKDLLNSIYERVK